jgi:mitofilin
VDALAEAAARGEATADQVAALRAYCASRGADADAAGASRLVEAVAATLPANERNGVPTVASLANRLEDVTRAARRLALVPEKSGGVFTHVVSGLASFLRARESAADDEVPGVGVEAALAQAAAAMARGRLAEAAAALEGGVRGSAAEAACAGWVADARERQRLEMAVAVLRAHAAAETATVA